jgi:glucose/mannose-6-phosphate isomerase
MADQAMAKQVPLPITIWRNFCLPPWAGEETLAVVSSYSGETEEALSAFHAALEQGARVIVLTSGGRLGRLAQKQGVPVIQISHRGEPRTAVGWSLAALIAVLESLELFLPMGDEIESATRLVEEQTERYGEYIPEARNPAKTLARRLHGRLPVIYGAGLLSAVARRWKTDINENAKSWAVAESLPELGHNAVTAYDLPSSARQSATVLLLRSSFQDPGTGARFQAIEELLDEAGILHSSVEAQGSTPLSHILDAVCLGGWVSYYLGLLYGVDPSATPGIAYMKRRLAAGREGLLG